jgi:Ulp1 family protease
MRFLQVQHEKEKGNNTELNYIDIKLDNVPQQSNGYDCGRYMLLYYEAILSYFSGVNSFVQNSENNINTKLSECITNIATKANIKSLDAKLIRLFSR